MITDAGRRHTAAIKAEREAHRTEAHQQRLEDDIVEHLAPGAIVFSKSLKHENGQAVAGVVVVVKYDRDSDPTDPTAEAAGIVEFPRDDVTVEPCECCGSTGVRRVVARKRLILVDDIAELHPRTATGMTGNSHRLGRAWIDRGNDELGMQYYTYAGILANEAGTLARNLRNKGKVK